MEQSFDTSTGHGHDSVRVPVSFVSGDPLQERLDAVLVFRRQDPFALTMHLATRSGVVTWTFARDLLVEGLYEPAGQADVQVWPSLSCAAGATVVVELSSPDGTAILQTPARTIAEFLNRTFEVVPLGSESEHLPIDELILRLLAG